MATDDLIKRVESGFAQFEKIVRPMVYARLSDPRSKTPTKLPERKLEG